MSSSSSSSLSTVLSTNQALVDQFLASLDTSSSSSSSSTPSSTADISSHPSPLHLLTASTTQFKSTVTKLSLLTITPPLTPSAISSTLQPLNTSILPSLVTSALLTSTLLYPSSFVIECHSLVRASLRDLKILIALIESRTKDGQPKSALSDAEKQNVTEATGKVWESCDLILQFSKGSVSGFAVRKAKQWLELMKDAVKELEEWDPEDENDLDDWGLGSGESGDEEEGEDAPKDNGTDRDRAVLCAGVKEQALKVLSRIPQSMHVVLRQRLEKLPKEPSDPKEMLQPMPVAHRHVLDVVLKKARKISECIDESAEAMYLGDLELCLKKAGEARALTIDVVDVVLPPWVSGKAETKEDEYIKRALLWIQQVQPTAVPRSPVTHANLEEKHKEAG